MSDKDGNSPDSFRESVISYFNIPSVAPIVGASMVILGSFLNWIETPILATTGIGSGEGYATILMSFVVLVLFYYNKYASKRMILSFLSSLALLLIALGVVSGIISNPQTRIGGGLYLTLAGALLILTYSLKQYSNFTSRRRTFILVAITTVCISILPAMQIASDINTANKKDQAEEDLQSLEIEQVSSYTTENKEDNVLDIAIKNPTSRNISVRIGYARTGSIGLVNMEVYQIRSGEEKQIKIRDTGSADYYAPTGYQNREPCEFDRYEYGEENEGFYYSYYCRGTDTYADITPDNPAYRSVFRRPQ